MNLEGLELVLNNIQIIQKHTINSAQEENVNYFIENFDLNKLLFNFFTYNEIYGHEDKILLKDLFKNEITQIFDSFELLEKKESTYILNRTIKYCYLNFFFNIEFFIFSILYNFMKNYQKENTFYDIINYIANNVKLNQEINLHKIRSRISGERKVDIVSILFLLKFLRLIKIEFKKRKFIFYLDKRIKFFHDINEYKSELFKIKTFTDDQSLYLILVNQNFINLTFLSNFVPSEIKFESDDALDLSILKTIQKDKNLIEKYENDAYKRFYNEKIYKYEKRDSILSNKLKIIYNYDCQICKMLTDNIPKFLTKGDYYYCEVHHIIPLSKMESLGEWDRYIEERLKKPMENKKNLDIIENMIVLCPYHHRFIHFSKQSLTFNKDENKENHYYFSSIDKIHKYAIFSKKGHYSD